MTAIRETQAAVALIRARHPAGWKYLCQWSDTWHALHFIGGHREAGETFRECAAREVEEELALGAADFDVAAAPLAHFEYEAFSASAGVPTHYLMAVFPTELAGELGATVGDRPENAWVGTEEVRAGRTADGRRISPSVGTILARLGQ